MKNFIQSFIEGSNIPLELELQSELQLKSASFKPEEHIQCFKSMVESHQQTSVASVGAKPASAEVAARDRAQYELVEMQLQYDLQVATVYFK